MGGLKRPLAVRGTGPIHLYAVSPIKEEWSLVRELRPPYAAVPWAAQQSHCKPVFLTETEAEKDAPNDL